MQTIQPSSNHKSANHQNRDIENTVEQKCCSQDGLSIRNLSACITPGTFSATNLPPTRGGTTFSPEVSKSLTNGGASVGKDTVQELLSFKCAFVNPMGNKKMEGQECGKSRSFLLSSAASHHRF